MTKANEEMEIERVGGNSPDNLIHMALANGSNLEQLERVLALKERYDANEAKKAYVQAMSDFKANAPRVTKDKQNSQYKSMYTTLGNLVNTVNPELSKHGLSASWDIFQNGIVKVTCKMTHRLGHSETAEASAPADTSGAKNPIQQIKSTITYLKAVTFESICGLASSDANLDDDGSGVGVELITEEQEITLSEYIMSTQSDEAKFLKFMGVESLNQIPKSAYQKAITALKSKVKK